MEVQRAVKIMIQVLGALEEAHGVGVIHRDLKPENILLTTQGGIQDTPKVLDFGLAKIKDQRMRPGSLVLTREGMVFGTPEFMSPEQARGETLDARSDIYSLCIIFYEMLTARLPFPRSKPMEYISHHIKTQPFKISERRAELNLPKELDPIVDKALAKDKNDRYQTAREFAEALQNLLPREEQSGPMHAVPNHEPAEPTGEHHYGDGEHQSGKSVSQGKGLVVALLAVIVVLLAVVAVLLITSSGSQGSSGVVVPLQSGPAPPQQPVQPSAGPPNPGSP